MNQKRKDRLLILLSVILLIALCGLYVLGLQLYRLREYLPIMQAAGVIKDNYFYYKKDTHEARLVDGAIDGLVAGTGDKYAEYYTEEEYQAFEKSQSNVYVGIGISFEVTEEEGAVIRKVYSGSPMEAAGALAGDRIVAVNGKETAGLSLDEVSALFSNGASETDTVLLDRGGERISVTVGKEEVYVPYTSHEMITDTVGYIRIDAFLGKVVSETRAAMEELLAQGMQSLIIDLRGNPGGGLDEVTKISKMFLRRGETIVTIMSRNEQEVTYTATSDGYDIPVTILVDGNSASASELFTAALRDNGHAVVVGQKTYGKGIIQSYFRLTSNNGRIRITTDAYFTPNNVNFHEVGIKPDIAVELPEEYKGKSVSEVPREEDMQFAAALKAAEYQIAAAAEEEAS